MNKKYLLSSVTAGIAFLYANQGMAQCVSTQDCVTLGYTETSCSNGNGVKCPFGNKWFCGSSDDTYTENECMVLACNKLGFKYTCSGSNISGGKGISCNGKYTSCNCSSGYKFTNGTCKELQCVSYGSKSIEVEVRLMCVGNNNAYRHAYQPGYPNTKYLESGGITYECSSYLPELSSTVFSSWSECTSTLPYTRGRVICKECAKWELP